MASLAARVGTTSARCLRSAGRVGGLKQQTPLSAKACSRFFSDDRGGMTEVMYNWRVAAVYNALRDMGKAEGSLAVEDLTRLGHLDQYHYLGVEANDHVIDLLGLDKSSNVLDIGAGIGGPARYIAAKSGCRITGVELQDDLCKAAADLTKRVDGLADRVSFVQGDFASLVKNGEIPPNTFDHFLSLLVFLHIPDRTSLLESCFRGLKPGGTFVIEDFMARPGHDFTDQETEWLRDVVSAPTVTSAQQYADDLRAAGFVDIEVVELSEIWKKWTKARHDLYVESKETTVATQGEEIYNSRVKFYKVIDNLFAGNLGGCRITGRKPSELEAKLLAGRKKDFEAAGGSVNVVEGMQRERAGVRVAQ
eukprot:TRINITY_DN20049_c0_g2_i1.p2 TRINITY_DN20049_c0_g2~~TRINITY_DN20049_c0_g2_i1.p2  ORF type:complete len:364 (+),score=74.50 TRINITY_DN20049_c0_g2_i1:73-1164(+)